MEATVMTVAELIAALQAFPQEHRVVIVYDSAVMNADITMAVGWRPDINFTDDKEGAETVVGLFEKTSEDDYRKEDPEWPDKRKVAP
jgi:broad specificity phosphatase PhoE